MIGTVLSITITLNLQVSLVFPATSLAQYFTCVVPTGKVAPGIKLLNTVGRPKSLQLSVAVGGVQLAT